MLLSHLKALFYLYSVLKCGKMQIEIWHGFLFMLTSFQFSLFFPSPGSTSMSLSSNSLLFINNLLLSLTIYFDSLNPNILPSTTFSAETSYAWHPEYRNAGFLSNLHPVAVKLKLTSNK